MGAEETGLSSLSLRQGLVCSLNEAGNNANLGKNINVSASEIIYMGMPGIEDSAVSEHPTGWFPVLLGEGVMQITILHFSL